MRNYSGSQWRKWDLHIHTPVSICQGYGGESQWEKFIDALERLPKEIKVIGITDYYFIDGYEKVMSYKKRDRLKNIEKIFPILEFRIDTFGSGNENKLQKINLHILFDLNENELQQQIDKVKAEFICQIPITNLDKHKTKMLSIDNLCEEGENDLHKGFSDLIPCTKKVFELINSITWKEKTFLFLGYKEWSNLEKNNQLRPLKEDLYDKVNAFFSSQYSSFDKSQGWLNEFGNKKLLHSGDIHDFNFLDTANKNEQGEYLPSSNYYCNTWIKADPTFEGLKQIIYEPDERVKVQVEQPEQKNDYNVIDTIQINHPDFNGQIIPLNSNLNTIIGGRSSGKSVLLGSIAKKIGTNRNVKEKNSKYEAYIDQEVVPSMNVFWKDGINDSTRNIEYFPQSYINNLAATSNEVNNLIENTVKNDDAKRKEIDNYISYCIENKSSINQEISNYFSLKEKLNEKLSNIKTLGSKDGVEKQIQKFKQEQNAIKDTMKQNVTEEEENKYKLFQNELEEIETKKVKSKAFIKQLHDLKSIKLTNNIADDLIGFENHIRNRIFDKYEILKAEFEKGFCEELDSIISIENNDNLKREERVQQLKNDDVFVKCKAYFSQNVLYLDIVNKLQAEERKLNQIGEIEKEIDTLNSKITSKLNTILNRHNDYFVKAIELVSKLNFSKDDVVISANPVFKLERFRELLSVRFNQKSFEVQDIVNYNYVSNDAYMEFITKLFTKIENEQIPLKGSHNKQQVIIDICAENNYKIEYDVVFQGDNLTSMSEGKKAFIILRILLDFNENGCPILIDQPEDDLDNRAIYDQLVDYLRKKKKERQIILVTHNPNIVVGADAEEVIVANQNGISTLNQNNVKFEYLTGALENSISKNKDLPVLVGQGIKQHVCDVLEGGNEAFLKREQKYGIK